MRAGMVKGEHCVLTDRPGYIGDAAGEEERPERTPGVTGEENG